MALKPLSHTHDSDFAGSSLDVRGWDVRTDVDDEKVGSVDDMLIDDSGRPRYLDVDLGLFRKHVLVPIGQARTDDRRDIVWVPGMTKDRFKDIPEWDHDLGSLDRGYADRLAAAYEGGRASRSRDDRMEATESSGAGGGLRELDDLDGYHIPKEESNPKGWKVVTADGREVGEVDELIVDTSAMMVRYLDCDLDQEQLGFDSDRERHVLIPLSNVQLDRDDKAVRVDGLTADHIQDLPVYGGLPIASDFEDRVRQAFAGAGGTGKTARPMPDDRAGGATPGRSDVSAGTSDSPYDDTRFDDRRFYGERLSRRGVPMHEDPTPSLRDREPMDEDVAERERAADRRLDAAADERRMAEDAARAAESSREGAENAAMSADAGRSSGEGERIRSDEEVRIRVRGDEIIVERRPKE